MLAYLFWHAPRDGVDRNRYVALLDAFHVALRAAPPPAFLRSLSVPSAAQSSTRYQSSKRGAPSFQGAVSSRTLHERMNGGDVRRAAWNRRSALKEGGPGARDAWLPGSHR